MKRITWLVSLTVSLGLATALIVACGRVPSDGLAMQRTGVTASVKTIAYVKYLARTSLLESAPPSDIIGDCGGKITYKNYNHISGTTTATFSFDNYCSTNTTTNDTVTINGDIPFVQAGTPSDSGPIISKITADAPLLTIITKDSTANTLATTSLGFAGFSFTYGTPGQAATDAKPDILAFKELSVKTESGTQTRSIMLRDTTITENPVTGGTKLTATGRFFRAETGYTDFTTTVPFILDTNFNLAPGGKISATGANNSNAEFTVTSGNPLTISASVNGTPLDTQLSCSDITSASLP